MPTTLPKAYRVETTLRDGTTTLSPRIAFRAIAATRAVEDRRHPDVVSAVIIPA